MWPRLWGWPARECVIEFVKSQKGRDAVFVTYTARPVVLVRIERP